VNPEEISPRHIAIKATMRQSRCVSRSKARQDNAQPFTPITQAACKAKKPGMSRAFSA
jgi:hypothetical protein